MRKLIMGLAVGLLGTFLVSSCCNCDKDGKCQSKCQDKKECVNGPEGPCEFRHHGPGEMRSDCPPMPCSEMCPEKKAEFEKWMKFDSLSADEQKALLKAKKAEIDQREAEMAAKKAEMEQKWANFDQLSIEEQKALIEMKMCPKMCPKKCGPRMCPPGDCKMIKCPKAEEKEDKGI